MSVTRLPLVGSRCESCGSCFYPSLSFCPHCHGDQTTPQQLSTAGILHSYSVVRIGPRSVSTPYAIGYVDLPEGVRVLARLDEWQDLLCDSVVEVHLAEIGGTHAPVATRASPVTAPDPRGAR